MYGYSHLVILFSRHFFIISLFPLLTWKELLCMPDRLYINSCWSRLSCCFEVRNSLFLSFCLSPCLCLSISVSLSLSIFLSQSPSLSISLTFFPSLYLSLIIMLIWLLFKCMFSNTMADLLILLMSLDLDIISITCSPPENN